MSIGMWWKIHWLLYLTEYHMRPIDWFIVLRYESVLQTNAERQIIKCFIILRNFNFRYLINGSVITEASTDQLIVQTKKRPLVRSIGVSIWTYSLFFTRKLSYRTVYCVHLFDWIFSRNQRKLIHALIWINKLFRVFSRIFCEIHRNLLVHNLQRNSKQFFHGDILNRNRKAWKLNHNQ